VVRRTRGITRQFSACDKSSCSRPRLATANTEQSGHASYIDVLVACIVRRLPEHRIATSSPQFQRRAMSYHHLRPRGFTSYRHINAAPRHCPACARTAACDDLNKSEPPNWRAICAGTARLDQIKQHALGLLAAASAVEAEGQLVLHQRRAPQRVRELSGDADHVRRFCRNTRAHEFCAGK
jgi:hypothetical protein